MKSGSKIVFFLMLFFLKTLSAKTLTMGVALRLNDTYNNTVLSLMKGIETAKSIFEKQYKGVKVQLRVFSHSEDLASVNLAADKIIQEKLPAVIGGEMSEESIVLGDRLGEQRIVFFSPTSTNPKVTENKPFVFRACFTDRHVATGMAKYVKEVLKPSAVGVIHNISSPYTDYLSSRFTETFMQLTAHQPHPDRPSILVQKVLRMTLDFSKQIDFFITNKVSHVAMFTHDHDLARFVLQAEEKKFFPVYIGSDGWGSNQYVFEKFIKESRNGDKFVGIRNSYWKEYVQSSIAKKFKSTFTARYGQKPEAWSAIAFDTAWLLLHAMLKAKDPNNGDEIRGSLKNIEGLKLVTTESFSFSEDNSPRKDLYLYRISKDGIRYEVTLK